MDTTIIAFLAACSFLQQVFTLSCYECNSLDNELCQQRPPDSVSRVCPQDNPVCRVIYLEVNTIFQGRTPHSRVVRTCGDMDGKDESRPCYRISDYGTHQKVCSCAEDHCNSSPAPASTLQFIGTALLLAMLL
ncbi:uncharacterized protein LOC128675555 [Plodia interpunctella]|uniref:uncharacterized protein LOC128675555 n=1 Tax=Plodia interpunctella TaxID=58824 RepID=UPI002367BCCA|nr:uncharacterized protein LOC128675555 [Plodia interpunctella]